MYKLWSKRLDQSGYGKIGKFGSLYACLRWWLIICIKVNYNSKKNIMARMFDTEFDYKDETYKATVVISGNDDNMKIAVQVPDELEKVVPKKKIVLDHYDKSQDTTNVGSKDPALVKSIMAAVEKHEEADTPKGSVWS